MVSSPHDQLKTDKYAIKRIAYLSVLSWSCGDETTIQGKIEENFEGILEVDAVCNILGGDTTDFRPQPEPGGPEIYSLKYACPNPAGGKTTSIHWSIPVRDSVWIYAFDMPGGSPVDTLYNRTAPPGHHSVLWSFTGPEGIYRVKMFTETGFTSYGDVLLED